MKRICRGENKIKNEWYNVEGITKFENNDIEIIHLELKVKANSIEEACKKARKFVEPVAQFEPTKCEWKV